MPVPAPHIGRLKLHVPELLTPQICLGQFDEVARRPCDMSAQRTLPFKTDVQAQNIAQIKRSTLVGLMKYHKTSRACGCGLGPATLAMQPALHQMHACRLGAWLNVRTASAQKLWSAEVLE